VWKELMASEGKCAIINGRCPRTNDPTAKIYCPFWTNGVVLTNIMTGEEKIEFCGARMLVPSMIEVIKASNRPAAVMESARNEIANGFAAVTDAIVDSQRLLEHKQ
jgi:hypothetical protein